MKCWGWRVESGSRGGAGRRGREVHGEREGFPRGAASEFSALHAFEFSVK